MIPRPGVEPQFYTPEEAAIVLGMSRRQVYKLVESGYLFAAHFRHLLRIPRKHLTPEMLEKLASSSRRDRARTEAST